jgi:hypothetical protein
MVLKYALVFVASFLVDWIWAAYIIETARKAAVKSTLLSGLIVLIGAFTTLSFMHDPTTVVAAVLGGMLGTYVSVKRNG